MCPKGGLGTMSRDGDSGSMASRRRVWYHTHRRHSLDEENNPTGIETECEDSEDDGKGERIWNGRVD